jgi:uncharacterized protein YigE (DUF2233 family)
MMTKPKFFIGIGFLIFCFGAVPKQGNDPRFLSFVTDPANIHFYWKNDSGHVFGSIQNLKLFIEQKNQTLKFAMNGGMYRRDNSPQGLYVESGKTLARLDTASGAGNFYLKPNGVFYITKDNAAAVCQTDSFVDSGQVKFATQSGPMLLIDGKIHSAFKKGSLNLNIRNGVGILPDGRVLFAMSKQEVNFYDFAEFFQKMACKNALYLDGFVSRAYLPAEKWEQLDGNFGVIIAVAK